MSGKGAKMLEILSEKLGFRYCCYLVYFGLHIYRTRWLSGGNMLYASSQKLIGYYGSILTSIHKMAVYTYNYSWKPLNNMPPITVCKPEAG